jgi:hypothetical protein
MLIMHTFLYGLKPVPFKLAHYRINPLVLRFAGCSFRRGDC